MQYTPSDHTFAICAYKDSPYLEQCICSLKAQTIPSNIIICTATPNVHIYRLAEKYNLPVFVHKNSTGIASDWNFSLKCSTTKLVTIAHQDDLYAPDYLKSILRELNKPGDSIIAFTSYCELQNTKKATSKNFINLRIKEMMLWPLTHHSLQASVVLRRRILSLADPICCPSVTYVKKNIPNNLFSSKYKVVLDWRAWERLSVKNGRFAYIPEQLVCHRMYSGSTTLRMIKNHVRTNEDLKMFQLFWPKPIAAINDKLYSLSQLSRKKLIK